MMIQYSECYMIEEIAIGVIAGIFIGILLGNLLKCKHEPKKKIEVNPDHIKRLEEVTLQEAKKEV